MSNTEDVFELITSYKLSDKATDRAYNSLVTQAIDYKAEIVGQGGTPTKLGFNMYMQDGEIKYMEEMHPDKRTRKGKWKFSFLPPAYRSAKSVIGTALDYGVEITGKGKTQLEKETKQAKTPVKEDSLKRAIKLVNNVASLRDKLDTSERNELDQYVRDTLGV